MSWPCAFVEKSQYCGVHVNHTAAKVLRSFKLPRQVEAYARMRAHTHACHQSLFLATHACACLLVAAFPPCNCILQSLLHSTDLHLADHSSAPLLMEALDRLTSPS